MNVEVAYKKNLFVFWSKEGSPYKRTSFLVLSDKDSKSLSTETTLLIRTILYNSRKNDGSAVDNVTYFRSLNCTNIKDSCNLENYDETYVR